MYRYDAVKVDGQYDPTTISTMQILLDNDRRPGSDLGRQRCRESQGGRL